MTQEQVVKVTGSFFSGLVASFWGIYGAIIVCVLVSICMDVVTGLVRAKATGESINSKTANRGFWKKMALITALAFGIFLDAFIPVALGVVQMDLPFKMPIGTIVGCYIVINEAISIVENINKAAPTALPRWIKKLLEGAKNTINDGGEKNDKDNEGG